MKYLPCLFLCLAVGCALSPQQQAQWDEVKQDIATLRTETKALRAEKARLEGEVLAGRIPANDIRERLEAISMRESEARKELEAAKGKLAEIQAAKTTNAVTTGLDVTGGIWTLLAPLLVPLLPVLGAVGPIIAGVRSGVGGKQA